MAFVSVIVEILKKKHLNLLYHISRPSPLLHKKSCYIWSFHSYASHRIILTNYTKILRPIHNVVHRWMFFLDWLVGN